MHAPYAPYTYIWDAVQRAHLSSLKTHWAVFTPWTFSYFWLYPCQIRTDSIPKTFCSTVILGISSLLCEDGKTRWSHLSCVYIFKNISFIISSCQREKDTGSTTKWNVFNIILVHWAPEQRVLPGGCELGAWCTCPERYFLNINNIFHTGLGEDASSSQITGGTTSPAASPLATVRILHQASNDLFASVTFSSRSIS